MRRFPNSSHSQLPIRNLKYQSLPLLAIFLLATTVLLNGPLVAGYDGNSVLAQTKALDPSAATWVADSSRKGVTADQSLQSVKADQPISVAYFYTIKWGFQDEFLELFRKNHYPLLEAQVKSGRLLKVEAYTPRYHGDGRADWNFMTVLVFKNWQAFGDNSEELDLVKKLYPDQEKFKKEEQRRFELLDAHWDVPLNPTPMK